MYYNIYDINDSYKYSKNFRMNVMVLIKALLKKTKKIDRFVSLIHS